MSLIRYAAKSLGTQQRHVKNLYCVRCIGVRTDVPATEAFFLCRRSLVTFNPIGKPHTTGQHHIYALKRQPTPLTTQRRTKSTDAGLEPPRFFVLRVPSTGPPALISEPNDFATRDEAEARVAEFEDQHLCTSHILRHPRLPRRQR
eukprot:m.30251 g.30251  ORF g.30251 m.30251 type:complete len:146 (+) comp16242_c0_seq1:279-716(+)